MSIIKEFILENYITLFELVGLLIMLRISAHISARMKRQTIVVIFLLILEFIFYRVELWTQSFTTLSIMRPILTACKYTIYPIILIFLLKITSSKDYKLTKDQKLILLIPLFISIPLYFTTQWTHYICWFDESNHYHGGFWYFSYWPYAIFALYSAVFLIYNIKYFKKYTKMNRLIPTYIVLGAFLGVILYIIFEFSDDYSGLLTAAIVLYYLCLYIHMAKIDPLTSLYNRQSYYQDGKHYSERITGVISVDMNELKYINDHEGHEAGDTAIKTVAEILRDFCGPNGTPYRVGGDEFMIFYVKSDEKQIQNAISDMRGKLSETTYSCAFGYSMKLPMDSLSDVIRVSDERMYANKAEMKKEFAEKGEILHMR